MSLNPPVFLEENPCDLYTLSRLQFASLIPKIDDYVTLLNLFPGNNAHAPWGTTGWFFLEVTVYVDSKPVGKIRSKCINEKGNIRLNFDEMVHSLPPKSQGICVIDLHHAKEIPVEVYLSHVHRESEVYVAYPALSFAGDQIYPKSHTQQLENTLFWPGITASKYVQPCISVINPYSVGMNFQIHLLGGNGSKEQTKVLHLKPYSTKTYSLEMLFPHQKTNLFDADLKTSLCVAAQYKVIAYMVLRDRDTGIISTIDHLHVYCLY
jgi:hypothetical protein